MQVQTELHTVQRRKSPLLSAAIALAVSAMAMSADAVEEAGLIEEVMITATRQEKPLNTIPNMVTVINTEALAKQIAVSNDLSTILGNQIPAFSPSRQKLSGFGEALRGRSPLYLIDGVPQSNPLRDGSRDGHTIDPLMLERVEVIHGANAIHGLGASGGAINLVTRKPDEDLQQKIRVETGFQQEDVSESLRYGLSYSLSGSWDAFDVLASASLRRTGVGYDADGHVIGFDNTQGDTQDADTQNLFIKAGYNWDDQRLELTVNDYEIEGNGDWLAVPGDLAAGIPTTAEKGHQEGDAPSNDVTMLSLAYSNEEILGHSLRIQGFSQDFSATYGGGRFATFQDPAFGADLYDQSQNNSEKLGLKVTLIKDEVAGLPLSLVYGVDVLQDKTYQELIQTGRNWVPETEYENYAPFIQAEYTGINKLTLTAGVRREDGELNVDDFTTLASYGSQSVQGGERNVSETLYNLGGSFAINDAWRVFANYSEGFTMPDVGRVLRGINTPGQSVDTFLDLQPIVTENQEFGVEFNAEKFTAQLSFYQSDSDFGQRLQAGADGIYAVKREKTEIEGLEFRAQWLATEQDIFAVQYAQSEGEFDSDQDGRVDTDLSGVNIAPDRVNLSWNRTWGDNIDTRLQVNHLLDRKFKDSDGETSAEFDGYTTVDLIANVAAFDGVISLGVQNLTNRDYFTYYSQTAGRDDRNFKGIGRSVSLSYSRNF